MFKQMFANFPIGGEYLNAQRAQQIGVAYTRSLQDRRTIEGACGQDDLAVGAE